MFAAKLKAVFEHETSGSVTTVYPMRAGVQGSV